MTRTEGGSAPSSIPVRHVDWPGLASGAILAAGTAAIYGRTFSVPFLLDDVGAIANNPSIRRLWPLWRALMPPHATGVGGRPLLNLSYAINYALSGNAVYGYHLVNLIIHVLAGWTLFALIRNMTRSPILGERFRSAATPLALAVSAIWTWHPLQTESVTYLSQRSESLMGLLYLLTLYCFTRGVAADDERRRRNWFLLSVFACLGGVLTKEVVATAPLAVLLYDRTFVSGSISAAWRRHRSLYLGLFATWLPLLLLMTDLRHRAVGFDLGVAWWSYGLTECRVVAKYILLCVWPHPLVFDYGGYTAARLSGLWPYAAIMASLLAATILAMRRLPAAGFAACWFLLLLAPTSSIIPIGGQPMAESRLYLPLAGVVAFAVLGAFAWAGRWTLVAFVLVAVALGMASARRNLDYVNEVTIWSDTVAKLPASTRAHNNLGDAWFKIPGRLDAAIAQYEETLRLQPDSAEAHYNLGNALFKSPGRLDDAIAQLKEALRLKPDFAAAHYNLALALFRKPGGGDEARAHLHTISSLALQPGNEAARQILAQISASQP